jgi:hypothetical protein
MLAATTNIVHNANLQVPDGVKQANSNSSVVQSYVPRQPTRRTFDALTAWGLRRLSQKWEWFTKWHVPLQIHDLIGLRVQLVPAKLHSAITISRKAMGLYGEYRGVACNMFAFDLLRCVLDTSANLSEPDCAKISAAWLSAQTVIFLESSRIVLPCVAL